MIMQQSYNKPYTSLGVVVLELCRHNVQYYIMRATHIDTQIESFNKFNFDELNKTTLTQMCLFPG